MTPNTLSPGDCDASASRESAARQPCGSIRAMLDAAHRARYDADGFLAPLQALTADEAAACRARLAPYLDAHGFAARRVRNSPHLLFTWAADLIRHPRIVDAVASLIGPDVLVRQSVLFIKPAGDPDHNAFHQDGAPWQLAGDRVVTAWIALTDSTVANGAVRMIPGSHRGRRLRHELRIDRHGRLLRGQCVEPVSEASALPIALRAGEFSLHHVWTVHGSPPNPSDAPRIGLAVRYMAPEVDSGGPRESVTVVRGEDRLRRHRIEPRPERDLDPAALRWHRRRLRQFALHVGWQIVREPSAAHLRLVGRLLRRAQE